MSEQENNGNQYSDDKNTSKNQIDIANNTFALPEKHFSNSSSKGKEVVFLEDSHNFCIAIIDVVGSTKMATQIADPKKIRSYYGIFLNITSTIAKSFGAKIVKNVGDSLIFYFPDTSDTNNQSAFKDVLECCTTLVSARDLMNGYLRSEQLIHNISYRVSADYGSVEVAHSASSISYDLFGTTVNMCAKINAMAAPNSLVLGGDLYQIIKSFPIQFREYLFKPIGTYSSGLKHPYSVYSCIRKNKKIVLERSVNTDSTTYKPQQLSIISDNIDNEDVIT